mmetsp:Transcript_28299/g.48518  ORF Transcript_28299/g.48518 Transcript_28299/m.48518 type:complete len:692 (-) Transcript_28299:686-2761(-)
MPGKEEIIFQGAKPFWRTRNTVDVKLVLHTALDVIEIVSYEPTFDKEAPRIYLKNSTVIANLDQEDIEKKLEEAKEPILRRRQVPDNAALLKDVVNSSASEYILNRLHIAEFDAERRTFTMEIKPTARDVECAQPGCADASQILCAKPRKLPMFKSAHYLTLLDGLADQMLEPARDERTGLRMLRRGAGLLYTNQERWRIPIIFTKVRNGRILTPSDARIWCVVTRVVDLDVVTLAVAKALDVRLTDRVTAEATKPTVGKSAMPLKTNLAAINTDLTAINTAYNTKDSRTPLSIAATPKSRHHPGRSSFADTSGVSGNASPNISPTKRAQLNRAPTGMPRSPFTRVNTAASSGSLLAGITASMKKHFSMGLTYTEDEESEPNKDPTSSTPQKLRGKPKAALLKKTKTARSGADSPSAADEAENADELEPEDPFESSTISQRISAGFSAFSTSIKRTLSFKPKLSAAASQAAFGLHEGVEDSDDEDVGFENEGKVSTRDESAEVNTGTGPTLSLENPSPSPSPKSVAVPSSPQRKKVNYAVSCDSNKPAALSSKPSVSPKTKKVASVAPKVHSRVASMRLGATLDTARSTTSDADALHNGTSSAPVTPVSAPPQTAEEFRDAMLKKQSTKTASAVRSINSRASFRANTYGLEDSDASTSNSPIAQFFSKMTPTWAGGAHRVLPTESAEVEAN